MSEQQSAVPVPYGAGWDAWARWAETMPVSQQIGLRCVSIEYGRAELVVDRSEWPLNPNGAVHGGSVIACADHCFGIVGSTVLDAEHVPATATLTADFLRPATPPLTFLAEVDRFGRTLAFITVTVLNGKGKVATKVSGTMVIDGSSRFQPAPR
ncbi:PaaI family thioesterase [Nocardia sp. NPDC059246]|uniref:PaaI family thioesterase n=1 Tax=unclassified Nocardia TaxID=2637762 RepID=UPI0036B3E7F8